MSVSRTVIAETLNLKEEEVSCKNCSAHEGEGSFLYCKFWESMTKSFEYCSFFSPEGVK